MHVVTYLAGVPERCWNFSALGHCVSSSGHIDVDIPFSFFFNKMKNKLILITVVRKILRTF